MATIKDVARLAGVSVSTVSLLLNGKRNISADKYDKIMAAMKELKYRPSIIAQNLKRQKCHLVGVILPTIENHYAQILSGIHSILDNEKHYVIVKISNEDVQKEKEIFEELLAMGVSGIICVPCDPKNIDKYKQWVETNVATIFVERRIESIEFSNVIFDNKKIIYAKTKELLKKYAPQDIALIVGPERYSSEEDCIQGYRDGVKDEYPDFLQEDLYIIETSTEKKRAMFKMLKEFGEENTLPKCIVFSGVESAEIFMEIQHLLKRDAEVYALSGDVWSSAKRETYPIKFIPREAHRMGETASEMLIRFIRNNKLEESRDEIIDTNYQIEEKRPAPVVVLKDKAPLKIKVLQSNAMDIMKRLLPNFTKETGISVKFNMVPFDELTQNLVGNPEKCPDDDILWVDIPLLDTMIRRGHLLDIRPIIEKDDHDILAHFPKGVRKCFFEKSRRIFGIPILMNEGLLYYRKDIFSDPSIQWNFYNKYGFELKPPKTWTEFNYVAEYFTKSFNPESPTKYGTALSLTCPTGFMEEFYIRQWACNGSMMDKWDKLHIDTIENTRALESLVTSYKYSPPNSLDNFFEETFYSLLSGDVAMLQGFPTHYLPFRHSELNMSYENNIGMAPLPGGKPLLGSWMLSINAHTQMAYEAYEFLRWVIRDDLVVAKGLLGNLIPVHATFNNALLTKNYPELKMMDIDRFDKELREVIRDTNGRIVDQYLFENVVAQRLIRAMTGEVTAMDAVKDAQKAVEELISKH